MNSPALLEAAKAVLEAVEQDRVERPAAWFPDNHFVKISHALDNLRSALAAAETRVEKEPIGWIIDDPVVGEILVRDEAQAKSLQAGIVENYAEWQPSFAVYTRPQEATP